jgi:exonuclease SbcC
VALRDVADRVEQRRHELAIALTARRDAVSQAAPTLRMARLATGGDGNDQSLTLATFVILQRFEDVLRAANTRLSAMSDGRYAVRRTEGREGGQRARKTGLGLEILDHCTDTARDPKTLSGGETFYVCLCLALGLADVVTGEAGGIELGTLFIDEGFGSLDSATLDDVMAELTQLHDHGRRAVGLVSHVAELKQRITERIEVRRAPGGGSTLAVTGHAASATTDREETMAAGNVAGGHGVAAEAHPRPAA